MNRRTNNLTEFLFIWFCLIWFHCTVLKIVQKYSCWFTVKYMWIQPNKSVTYIVNSSNLSARSEIIDASPTRRTILAKYWRQGTKSLETDWSTPPSSGLWIKLIYATVHMTSHPFCSFKFAWRRDVIKTAEEVIQLVAENCCYFIDENNL